MNLALNNQQRLICHKTQTNNITIPGQSGPGSNDNKGVLHIPHIFQARALPSDCLMSYRGHSFGESYHSAEMQSVYSTALGKLGWFMPFSRAVAGFDLGSLISFLMTITVSGYVAKMHLVVRLHFWSFMECSVIPSLPLLLCSIWLRLVVSFHLFENY